MIVSNLRLVNSIALKYAKYVKNSASIGVMDLISEGNMALRRAIDNYNLSLGNRFSTYATPCIIDTFKRFLTNNESLIRKPAYYGDEMSSFKKKVSKLEQQAKRELSTKEIAEALSIPLKTVMEYQKNMQTVLSLEERINEEDDLTLKDIIRSNENIEEKAEQQFLSDDIRLLLEKLSDKEQLVIKMYFGIDGYEHSTLKVIGKAMGVSPERIRQKIAKALREMRLIIKTKEEHKELKAYLKR